MNTICFLVLLLSATSIFAQQAPGRSDAERTLQKADKRFFIENKGQWHSDVLYLTRMGGLDVWITKYGVNYTFYKMEKKPNAKQTEHLPSKFDDDLKDATLLGHRVLMKLQNHNANPQREGKQKQAGYYNYLIGNDPSKHASNVGLYKEAVVKSVYNGIDLRYYFDKGYLRYDFIVQPGADPSQIRFKLEGEDKEYLKNGALCYTTHFGEVQMQDLYVYQQSDKKQVPAKFTQQNGVWRFQLSAYDKTQPLIIDPLIYSTYIGGTLDDEGSSIAIDGSGNAYVTGVTYSTNYDITAGAFQTNYGGGGDVFVTKLNSTGTALIYSTYIGGSGNDVGYSIAVDGSGNAYITGHTTSTNYNTTAGAFQTTYGGGGGHGDVFVTKLNSTGTGLIYSTYIGGSNSDRGNAIAIDGSGNAYITGITASGNYDITSGVFQTTYGGGTYDVFVTKLNSTGSGLIYSTYIGGSGEDLAYAIAIDGSGNAYITGASKSTDYDTTSGAFQTTNGGGGNYDVFVTKLNSTGTALMYSTYIGGSNDDAGFSIAIDGSGNAYVTGYAEAGYDTTTGAFQTNFDSGNFGGTGADIFVTKLNSTGTALLYSTYIGGLNGDIAYSIAIDGSGNAYITGYTYSANYDITTGAFQTTKAAFADVFVTKLNSTGTALLYSTYIGGGGDDQGNSIAIDGSDYAYIVGETSSNDYDITAGAFQTTRAGGKDVFVTKLGTQIPLRIELLSFVAEKKEKSVKLDWTTATEFNNDYFELEKSTDAINFQAFAKIKGAGFSNQLVNYSHEDLHPLTGTSYYRLKQVDFDGSFTYSSIRVVHLSTNIKFSIYPNPNQGTFTIQTSKDGVFELSDVTGKVINTYTLTNPQQTVNENLPVGMYFVREKQSGVMQKLVVQ
jgi:hypothetical protein